MKTKVFKEMEKEEGKKCWEKDLATIRKASKVKDDY